MREPWHRDRVSSVKGDGGVNNPVDVTFVRHLALHIGV